ncbi:hypothetical protein PGT21_025402 [Puccinia graminis f. sp. tritici]|uniref:Uncharacterized protein n=1 Tax=Puccinia graminis f. sp. tritici TaxID=56615 RepID=A0A5B0QX07_PUCGR|nr:hypothetical protein PGT21_025402 [Puccinia graminis f. sp. tritici]
MAAGRPTEVFNLSLEWLIVKFDKGQGVQSGDSREEKNASSVFQSYEASTKHCGRIGNRTNDHRCSDGQSLVKIGTDYLAWIVYLALFPQQ